MIYVKHGHGKWVRKDLDAFNGYNNFRKNDELDVPFLSQIITKYPKC